MCCFLCVGAGVNSHRNRGQTYRCIGGSVFVWRSKYHFCITITLKNSENLFTQIVVDQNNGHIKYETQANHLYQATVNPIVLVWN